MSGLSSGMEEIEERISKLEDWRIEIYNLGNREKIDLKQINRSSGTCGTIISELRSNVCDT